MSIIHILFPCLFSARGKSTITTNEPSPVANQAATIILSTDDPSLLHKHLSDLVTTTGWTESLARGILNGIENAISNGAKMAQPASDALARATTEAYEFARDHPVYTTILALGVLVILAPWVLEVLGFGELGPIEGSFAAWWQRLYAGEVPKGSLFSFFQRLGMVWSF